MTSRHASDGSDDQWPVPLTAKKGEIGDAVRAYARTTDQAGGESPDFGGVMARMERRPRRAPVIALGIAAGALAAATAVFLMVRSPTPAPSPKAVATQRPASPSSSSPSSSSPVVATSARPKAPPSARASLVLGEQPVALPAGESEIVAKAAARLSPDAAASGRSHEGVTELALQRGELELHVLPQAPGHRLVVVAGRHRFTVVGTAFTVSRNPLRVELRVDEGAVAVSRGTRQLTVVEAGGRWHADETAPAPSAPTAPTMPAPTAAVAGPSAPVAPVALHPAQVPSPPSPPPPPSPTPTGTRRPAPQDSEDSQDCRQLATSGRMQEAVGCYQQRSAHKGLAGETAAYELARLWRDTLGQPDRAMAAFEEQRSRFPSGALRREADLSIIELLPRLGRHAEALAESERFLSAHPRDERQGEIHLLRGNIYREVFRDLAHARLEYAAGAVAKGRAGDDSRFFHAVCLEALGSTEEARAAYQAYLDRGGAHSAEARARLSKLAP